MIETSMRQAFIKAKPTASPVVGQAINALMRGVGVIKPKKMWNANLSFRTYQSLKRQGIME